jgi:hypothetical protein
MEYVPFRAGVSMVNLKERNTYWSGYTIRVASNTAPQGDPTAVAKLIDHANWPKWRAMTASRHGMGRGGLHRLDV